MKKTIPIMIAAAMLFAGCIVVLDNDVAAANEVYVNGDHNVVSEDVPGCTYDAVNKVLTLENANLNVINTLGGNNGIINSNVDHLIIELVGNNNNITYSGNADNTGGIVANDLTFRGTGSLTVTATNATYGILAGHVTVSSSTLDYCFMGFTMTGGTLNSTGILDPNLDTVISGTAVINANVIEIGSGSFTMNGGTINMANTGYIDVNDDVTINGGSIIFQGDLNDGFAGVSANGNATFTMAGGSISVSSATAGRILIQSDDPPGGSMNYGEATLSANLSRTSNMVTVSSAGPASISFGDPTYTVSFDANGGSGTMADATGISGSYTLPASTFTAPAGKEFKCWSVADVEKNVGDSITVTANTTVKAIWQAAGTGYTVTFDANGGTGTMAQATGVSGEYTLPESTFTAPDGKEFKCWKVGEEEKNAGDKITVTGNITVKAVWKDKSSGGGSNLGLIIGGAIAGVLVVGAVAFFLIRKH